MNPEYVKEIFHISYFINGYESGLAAINCGVPQGSVLGPLLFLLYINDLNQAKKFCKVHHFVDDTNLLCLSNSIKKLSKLVNADLKHLLNWLNANKISLNVKKTETIIFKSKQKKLEGDLKTKLCGKRLYPIESVKYLSVKIDANLTWQHHANGLSIKLRKLLFKMRKLISSDQHDYETSSSTQGNLMKLFYKTNRYGKYSITISAI